MIGFVNLKRVSDTLLYCLSNVGKRSRAVSPCARWHPLLPLPDSQQAEDYPRDMAGEIRIAADAALGAQIRSIVIAGLVV